LEKRALRSIQFANEAALQGVVELLLDNPARHVPELRLVLDGMKEIGRGRFGFVDIFVLPTPTDRFERTQAVVIELKYITLKGLAKGEANDPTKQPTHDESDRLIMKLQAENDETLLNRRYIYWSIEDRRWARTTVREVMDGAKEQLSQYIDTIKMGPAKQWTDSGVLDSRVEIKEWGNDRLNGHVIMVVGKNRVLTHSMKLSTSQFEYRSLLAF
jgi:hypothetical protein